MNFGLKEFKLDVHFQRISIEIDTYYLLFLLYYLLFYIELSLIYILYFIHIVIQTETYFHQKIQIHVNRYLNTNVLENTCFDG